MIRPYPNTRLLIKQCTTDAASKQLWTYTVLQTGKQCRDHPTAISYDFQDIQTCVSWCGSWDFGWYDWIGPEYVRNPTCECFTNSCDAGGFDAMPYFKYGEVLRGTNVRSRF